MSEKTHSVRKAREHPYTNQLNRIKSKICYYKKRMNEENADKIKDIINDLEYERFILKLNPHDFEVISKFCSFNKLSLNVKEILNQFLENMSEDA